MDNGHGQFDIVLWRKATNDSKGKPDRKYDAAFSTIFKFRKCLQRIKQKLNFLLLNQAG